MSASVQAAFGLFDDENSEDEEQAFPVITAPVRLVEQLKIVSSSPSPNPSASSPTPATTSKVLYAPWEKTSKPLFVGDIDLVSDCMDVGGRRGYVATEDLAPGTLVLVEKVFVEWPRTIDTDQSDPKFFICAMESILQRVDYIQVIEQLSHLYPQNLCDLPDHVLSLGRTKYISHLEEARERFIKAIGDAGTIPTLDQLFQNVMAMQCNAFDSGIFLYNAMFNHECVPNCVKFTPEDQLGVSEVRVAKTIKRGEPLSLSYLYPREQSRERRQQILHDQFGFTCQCWLCKRGDSVLPLPLRSDTSNEEGFQVNMEQVETTVTTAEDALKLNQDVQQVLSVALEALSDALEIVAHDHVVLIRIHKLVADCCDLILRARPTQDVREYAILFLRSSYELLELQQLFLDTNHVDLARTLNDVSQGIQLLLAIDPQVLITEFTEWKDFRQASMVENEYRQRYQRIKMLYE